MTQHVYNSAVESTSSTDADSDSIMQRLLRLRSVDVLSKYDSSQGGFQPPVQAATPVLKLETNSKSASAHRARAKKQLNERRKFFQANSSRCSAFVEHLEQLSSSG